ncbi:GNAT family N-acetyltransferase [Solibacillus sp. CAU 1738]|uniref:GNAT family N-acetyltransferase n=1 Tax=Solibacillus sp. CAU 1738 TaxID=3140363 RepID=UPI003260B14C
MLEIRKIEPELTYSIRHTVLRPNQTLEDSMYETDHDDYAFHVGAFFQGMLVSVASFIVDRNPDFPIDKQYRLRQMATLGDYRNIGAGRAVVNYGENLIKDEGFYFLWCKGRTNVQEYYSRLGFHAHGEVFDYPPIGPHILMYKELK